MSVNTSKSIRASSRKGVMMAENAFANTTSAFFDELSKILESQQSEKEDGMDMRNDRPYSSLLTQDEEPNSDYIPNQVYWQEPEIVTRGGI